MVSGGMGDSSDAAWRPPPTGPQQVEHLDGYTDLVEVGRGGDSVVYRARQESVYRDVAIKVLSIDSVGDPVRSARFAREIEITVQLGRQHPNIVTVLATGTTASGRPAVVMDFFEGGTLHDRLKAHGPLLPEEVGRIGEVLADALSFAHERGVLHRDVKPQNVLVLPTSWVLADFGIARMMDAEHTSSAETFTYRHAAPQILDGHAADARRRRLVAGLDAVHPARRAARRSPATTPTRTPRWPTCDAPAPSRTGPSTSRAVNGSPRSSTAACRRRSPVAGRRRPSCATRSTRCAPRRGNPTSTRRPHRSPR